MYTSSPPNSSPTLSPHSCIQNHYPILDLILLSFWDFFHFCFSFFFFFLQSKSEFDVALTHKTTKIRSICRNKKSKTILVCIRKFINRHTLTFSIVQYLSTFEISSSCVSVFHSLRPFSKFQPILKRHFTIDMLAAFA